MTDFKNKKIYHILNHYYGFGDYLRGTIFLYQNAEKHNLDIQLYVANHVINKFLENEQDIFNFKNVQLFLVSDNKQNVFDLLITDFINSSEQHLYITTNYLYIKNCITDNTKKCINEFFKFKQKYYDIAREIIKTDTYNILHIRCHDNCFDVDFHSDKLLVEILKLNLDENTLVISNNYSIKKKLNKLFGFKIIENKSVHFANKKNDYNDLESTIIDYILLSKSSSTYCISFYGHGSGFSEQCSVLHNVPYKLIKFNDNPIIDQNNPTKDQINDILLLLKQYDLRLNTHELIKESDTNNI